MHSCRFCLEEESDKDKLIAPCDCKGSLQYVHRECQDKWFERSFEAKRRCQVCGHIYDLSIHDTPLDQCVVNLIKLFFFMICVRYEGHIFVSLCSCVACFVSITLWYAHKFRVI